MELMKGGELFDHIVERDSLNESEARDIITPILDAIIYCHSLGIVHRDIKPENLLFSTRQLNSAIIKVSDFGLSRHVDENSLASTTCGTPGYVAPEILEQKPYNQTCDYFSIGVVLFTMLCGEAPFFEEDRFELFEKIKQCEYNFNAPAWLNVSDDAKDFIRKLLVPNPETRLSG